MPVEEAERPDREWDSRQERLIQETYSLVKSVESIKGFLLRDINALLLVIRNMDSVPCQKDKQTIAFVLSRIQRRVISLDAQSNQIDKVRRIHANLDTLFVEAMVKKNAPEDI